ncbi:thioredoxin domain-containing protein [Roseomonas sp. M0104]|uniref:Thioredoxin domain-containing protein n=1 Tax=Teichococcus coralli TaxID=2545983 RepID=A0A845BDX4_9PROT|nr:thioredoxin domain-containing protein [Pseudoroseomonas coralli]MXP64310.1 thioredoxin domain-containing protein [Pseudoroseomonas coralli]
MPEIAENLLRHETSPYLLQHAENPVHWRPWGAAALEEARKANRPILLSVGYAACHWCHVMAHESFEDPETAALMNRLFVNIKVDREERPDIDALYMGSLHLLGEQGGWPLTMFLTPEGAPFWGGTYFPPEPRWGRPSFRQVLQGLAQAYREEGGKVAQNVAALKQGLARMAEASPGALPGPAELGAIAQALVDAQDRVAGGMQGAPKFPNPPVYRFLLQMAEALGRPVCAEPVHLLLRRMSQGGIYDHLGGGYARYSTDAEWLVPHFEKMLYDNAQILELLALVHARQPDPLYAARAAETVAWLEREMLTAGGAFAATQDADSEGEEGRFYVWQAQEIDSLLGDRAPLFRRVYDVSEQGNWEGKAILNRTAHPDPLSGAEEAILAEARALLLAARAKRIAPGRDDKVLADWNGLMIAALARAGAVFDRPEWLSLARRAFAAVAEHMAAPDGRLHHAWRANRSSAPGLLEDHAAMARAALALFEALGDTAYLRQAMAWAEVVETRFAAPEGGYFTSADDATDVLVRGRTAGDNATPAGNGVMAEVQARLFHLTGEARWRQRAEATIAAFSGLAQALLAMPTLLSAADLLENGATLVVAGAEAAAEQLAAAALALPDPAVMVLRVPDAATLPQGHPAFGKGKVEGRVAAYPCRGGTCGLPVLQPERIAAALRRVA